MSSLLPIEGGKGGFCVSASVGMIVKVGVGGGAVTVRMIALPARHVRCRMEEARVRKVDWMLAR